MRKSLREMRTHQMLYICIECKVNVDNELDAACASAATSAAEANIRCSGRKLSWYLVGCRMSVIFHIKTKKKMHTK